MSALRKQVSSRFLARFAKGAGVSACAALAIAGFSAVSQAEDYPEMSLKFGHQYNETHPLALGAVRFADIVKEKSGGKITVQVFPNSTIGNAKKLLEAMQINVVDLALAPTTNVANFYEPLNIYYLPFLFRDRFHAYAVSDGMVGKELNEGLLKKTGFRTIGMYESGFRTITTRDKKISMPDDMKGVKFRVVGNPLNVATFKALGANVTTMALSEVFTALQQGTVDGQDNPIGNVKAFGFDKVQKNITLSNHQWAGIMFLANDRKFSKYPKNVQDLLLSAAKETEKWERDEINKVEAKYLAEMEAGGMTVTRLTPAQSKAFQDKMSAVWEEYTPKIGADLVKAAVDTK